MADPLQAIVQKMIDAGESEDNIATVIQHFKGQSTGPKEPDTYWGGFLKSAGQTATDTAKGIGEGALSALNPINLVRGPYELGTDLITNKGAHTLAGVKAIASGDPRAGGNAIGNLLTGAAVGRGVGMLRTAVTPETLNGIPVTDLKAAGVGDQSLDLMRNGRPPATVLRMPAPKPSPAPPAGPQTRGTLALASDPIPSPASVPMGTPRVIGYKTYSDNLAKGAETPWSATSQFGPSGADWHSGLDSGTPEAAGASSLHRALGEMDRRYQYLMDSEQGFGRPGLTANPGRAVSAAAGAWIAHKLGLPGYMGGAAGYMAPEIAMGGAQAATSPVGSAALRAAILARLTSGIPDTSTGR